MTLTNTDKLVQEFLARGGEVRRIEKGMRAKDVATAPIVKKRNILADLKARAAKHG